MKKLNEFTIVPPPKTIKYTDKEFNLFDLTGMHLSGDSLKLLPIAEELKKDLAKLTAKEIPISASTLESPSLRLIEKKGKAEAYCLKIDSSGIEISGCDAQAIFYGAMTLKQILLQAENARLSQLQINDSPDFSSRGVMIDVSRDKIPTLETLFNLVDMLSYLKINHLELYMEHSFAYRKHSMVWADSSPLTAEDILKLDAYCKSRFVELVPNQNSFGHMTRWLKHPQYQHLAECMEYRTPESWGAELRKEPNSISPVNKESIEFLDELYSELLPNFSSKKFNTGCDETVDLGQGKSAAECEKLGKGRVYLNFLLKIYKLVKNKGKTMHFWGDIILHHPELVKELPKDVVVLNWGYEADHPFANECKKLGKAGLPFFVCPGTSTWNTAWTRLDNCIDNLKNAAVNGLKNGATGYLITDWGDNGHWQVQPASYPGFTAGASLAWNSGKDIDLIKALNTVIFKDKSGIYGKAACDLGMVYKTAFKENPGRNASSLARLLLFPDAFTKDYKGLDKKNLRQAENDLKKIVSSISKAMPETDDAKLLKKEIIHAAKILIHACHRGILICEGKKAGAEMLKEIRELKGRHQEIWLARNRPGGLQDSLARFTKLQKEYEG